MSKRILVIPDTQVKPGVRTDHLEWIGKYVAAKRPDVVVHLGDHWDMPSLSSYDKGKASAEGRRVIRDIEAGNAGLQRLCAPFRRLRGYSPRLVILRGNHEQRLERYTEDHPELEGAVGYHQFNDRALGWEVVPFLETITIEGVTFCHYFPRSGDGNISQTKRGAPSARAQVLREMRSTVAGHKQGLDVHIHCTGSRTIRGVIAGSCYLHQEAYLSPQGVRYWRGVLSLHEVKGGNFALTEVTLDWLRKKYG
jgi:predicted phosphodiesterase